MQRAPLVRPSAPATFMWCCQTTRPFFKNCGILTFPGGDGCWPRTNNCYCCWAWSSPDGLCMGSWSSKSSSPGNSVVGMASLLKRCPQFKIEDNINQWCLCWINWCILYGPTREFYYKYTRIFSFRHQTIQPIKTLIFKTACFDWNEHF